MSNETKPEKVCAFCDKTSREVAHLIARRDGGPMICNECTSLAVEMSMKQFHRLTNELAEKKRELKEAQKDNERLRGEKRCRHVLIPELGYVTCKYRLHHEDPEQDGDE